MPSSSFQTLTIEYRVFDQCDGLTDAPPFVEGVLDDRQIYVFEVQRLGVIPLRFGDEEELPSQPACPTNCFITWSVLTGVPAGFDPDSGMSVGYQDRLAGTTPSVEPIAQISVGFEGIYLRRCVKVPQGGVIIVDDIDAPVGQPAIIRLRVQVPENGEQLHQLELACCCKEELPDINLPDVVDTDCPSSLAVNEIDPAAVAQNDADLTNVAISGAGFEDLGLVSVTFVGAGADPIQLPTANLDVQDDNTIRIDVLPNQRGTYTVFVGDPTIQNCFAALLEGFEVT